MVKQLYRIYKQYFRLTRGAFISMNRSNKTALNSIVGLIFSLINSILSFVLRAIFIRLLGLEYAGVNTLFSDVLSILNLAELGFNNAILFRLYKTIFDNDDEKTELYLTLYKKICYIVGTFVAVAGVACIPFLRFLIKDTPKFSEPLWSIYILILLATVVTHFVNYKSILLIAKQDRYITTIIQYSSIFLRNVLQLLALIVFKSIYLYLAAVIITNLANGIINGIVSNKKYHLSWKSKKNVSKSEREEIFKDVGALSVYKICRTVDATVDTFLISKFIAVSITAIYGSIMMLLNAIHELLGVFNDGMIASLGDLNASGNKKNLESVFYETIHFTFLIYGISTAILMPLLPSFSIWWIGHSLNKGTIVLILINFYMYGIGMNIATYRNSLGIFVKGWKRPAITALLNLIFSVFLISKIGIAGTILGTLISRILTGTWYDPYIILRYGIDSKPYKYYFRYIVYFCFVMFISFFNTNLVGKYLSVPLTFVEFVKQGIIYLIISIIAFLVFGCLFSEQKIIITRIKTLISIFNKKIFGRH